MAIQHNVIPDADLHPPKGASTATVNETIHSNGTGGVTWEKVAPIHMEGITSSGSKGDKLTSDGLGGWTLGHTSHGSIYFVNTSTPNVLAATTSFAKVSPTTTASGTGIDITEATTARLTYTGAAEKYFTIICNLSVDHAAGVNRDISIAMAKNGTVVALTEQVTTCTTGNKQGISTMLETTLTTNDYIEVFLKISSAGNVNIYCYNMQAVCHGAVA